MEPNATSKRVVSKGAYLRAQVKRGFWWLDSLLFYLAAYAGLVIVLCFACGILRFAPLPALQALVTTDCVWLMLFLPVLIYVCSVSARWCLTHSRKIDAGVPLLASTVHYLPAPERLVRPSSDPAKEQPQTVLLRPIAEGQQTPPEQLVRAVRA